LSLYNKYILPKLVHFACSGETATGQREKVVPEARGRVLEVGVGSGLNFPFYDTGKVEKVWGLEPSSELTRMAEKMAATPEVNVEVEFIDLPGEEIPLDDKSVDTVLITYTLCSITETEAALRQMARVLKPGGELLFCEHGVAPDANVRKWQERLNPIWNRFSGGCHMNRDIPKVIESGGFKINTLETMYLPGWRPTSFNYWGTAVHR
jgi:ubiquinone/menaquinone biosynthesis C-methylase UbiE